MLLWVLSFLLTFRYTSCVFVVNYLFVFVAELHFVLISIPFFQQCRAYVCRHKVQRLIAVYKTAWSFTMATEQSLFRSKAVQAQQQRLEGQVSIVQPVS